MRKWQPLRNRLVLVVLAIGFQACDSALATDVDLVDGPLSMVLVSGNGQSGAPGAELTDPLIVKVTDASGRGLRNRIVNWVVTEGGGSVYGGVSLTNSDGHAQERWTLGPVEGQPQVLEARAVDSSTGEKLAFGTFRATAGTDPTDPPPEQAAVETVEVAPASWSLQVGGTGQLTVTLRDADGAELTGRTVTYSSSNTGIATVSGTGFVRAIAAGTAILTAASEGKSGTSTVTVTSTPPAPVASVAVTPSSASLSPGGTVQLTATLRDGAGNTLSDRTVTWTTSNGLVAAVSGSGLVTAGGEGSAVVTATSEGVEGTSSITVTAPPPPPTGEWGTDVVFESDWGHARGDAPEAQSDGGMWPRFLCPWSGVRQRVLHVVAASEAGWQLSPNILRVNNAGGANCGQVELDSGTIPTGRSYFVRNYTNVWDENQPNFHPSNFNQLEIDGMPWAIWEPRSNGVDQGVSYRPKFAIKPRIGGSTAAVRFWTPALQQRTWYRFEYHVEFVDVANRRARIWPRIYTMAGTLLYDADDHVDIDNPGRTLAQYYAQGGYHTFASLENATRYGLGYEGTALATNQGRKWYHASVRVCMDNWCGPK